MEHPATQGDQWAVYSPDLSKGVGLAFQTEKVDELYQRALAKKLPIKTELGDFNWGQRGFAIFEPNGLVVFVYATEVGSQFFDPMRAAGLFTTMPVKLYHAPS